MPSAVKLSDHLIKEARKMSKAMNRSLSGQVEHWAKIGKIAEENPDLPYEFIKDVLIALQEEKEGKFEPFNPEDFK